MLNRLTSLFSVMLVVLVAAALAQPVIAAQDETANTEDVIYMNDGRELRGHIVSETPSQIVFEYIDRNLNLSSKLTLQRAEIAKIERDVPIPAEFIEEEAVEGETPLTSPARSSTAKTKGSDIESTYGIKRFQEVSEFTKRIYIVPMTGQMGTDVNPEVYEGKIVEDIRALDPDYIVFKMDCKDFEDRIYTRFGEEEQNPHQGDFLDIYRELVSLFRDDLRDIPQVMWIQDSVGISSVVAMAWPDLYMTPSARFGGLEPTAEMFMAVEDDPNMFGKFREGMMAWLKGFAEYGGYDLKLLDAMVIAEKFLSASWSGRDVVWTLDDSGEYIVDLSDEHTVNFRAKDAEDFGISDGTVETLDDLALMLGIREYVVLDGVAEDVFEDHKEDWRRALDQSLTLLNDYQQYLGWAQGQDTVRYLGRCKDCLEKVLAAIERYKAVEYRLALYGVNKLALITQIERIKEQLRAARSNERPGGGLGGGSGRSGGRGR